MDEGSKYNRASVVERSNNSTQPPRKPITTVDVPFSPATSNLFDGLRKGRFTERQRKSLASDEVVGPLYKNVMEKCEVQFQNWEALNRKTNKHMAFALCTSSKVCPAEYAKWQECMKTVKNSDEPAEWSDCREFKEDADRCGVRMSQLMLRAALADQWF